MPTDEELDLCEFGITHEKCYFCGQPRTILFSEHYIFCPNCSVIYTNMILQESGCDHITKDTPYISKKPWYTYSKAYIHDTDDLKKQVCSICGAECESDGW